MVHGTFQEWFLNTELGITPEHLVFYWRPSLLLRAVYSVVERIRIIYLIGTRTENWLVLDETQFIWLIPSKGSIITMGCQLASWAVEHAKKLLIHSPQAWGVGNVAPVDSQLSLTETTPARSTKLISSQVPTLRFYITKKLLIFYACTFQVDLACR